MLRLPPSIERRLTEIFPDKADREHFVARVIEDALQGREPSKTATPMTRQSLFGMDQHDMEEEQDVVLNHETPVGGTLYLFSDGGSRGNPGQAAIACILEDPKEGVLLRQHAERIGIETNNVAEYRALIKGLEIAKEFHPRRLVCHLDSELVVRQLNGQYQVKMPTLEPLFQQARQLTMAFPDIIFKHIPRGDNHRADALVNKVLNEASSPSTFGGRPLYR